MSDPERLLHGSAGPLAARLLGAGHDEAPPRRSLERTLAAVGVATTTLGAAGTAGALGLTAGTAGAVGTATGVSTAGALGAAASVGTASKAATTLTLLGIAKWAGLGVAGGIAVSLAAHGMETRVLAPRAKPSVVGTAPSVAGTAPSVAGTAPSVAGTAPSVAGRTPAQAAVDAVMPSPPRDEAERAEPSASPADAKDPRTSLPGVGLAPRAANVDDATNAPLAAEVTFVDRGRALFQRGDARGVLATLAGYEREFPERRLLPEVLFLRMEASAAAGDATRAEAFARVIVRDYGKSPHAARARALLGDHAASQR